MRKFIKKFSGLLVALSFMALVLPFTAYAAEGKIQFSDPTCAAGEEVDINFKVITQGNNIGAYEVNVKYDPKMLRFESGDYATASNGIITITYDGGEVPDTLHVLKFTALKNGETKLGVEGYNAEITSGEELNLTTGSSLVKIEGGTPVEDEEDDEDLVDLTSEIEVVYKDQMYYITSDFEEDEVPLGFEKITTEYEGNSVSAIANEVTGQQVFYGYNDEGESVYLFDDAETGTLRLAELISINRNVNIFVMDYPEDDKMPEHIKPTTMTLNEKKFMIWNNIENQDFYYVYAFSNQGTKGYYEYDSIENTYQRANMADFIISEEETEEVSPVIAVVENNLLLIAIAVISLTVILLIVIITLSVKLYKRGKMLKGQKSNYEYDGYEESITDDVNDYDEDDVYDIDFDDYDDGDIDSFDDISDYDDDEFEITFDDDSKKKNKKTKKKSSKRRKNNDDDDDFSIDFIEI